MDIVSLVATLDIQSADVAPIDTLPPELLLAIFLHHIHASHSTAMPVVLLTQICRSWRQLALSTPELWCSIELHVPIEMGPAAHLRHAETARKWVEVARSAGPFELIVRYTSSVPVTTPFPMGSEETFSTLLLNKAWGNVRAIDLTLPINHLAFFSLPAALVPHLEDVKLSMLDRPNAPMANFPTVGLDSNIILPWVQLKNLHMHHMGVTASSWRRVFGRCTNLVTASFCIDNRMQMYDMSSLIKTHDLPHLHTLALAFVAAPSFESYLFTSFRFINLKSLTLEHAPANALLSLVVYQIGHAEARFQLKELTLKNLISDAGGLLGVLKYSEELTRLRLEGCWTELAGDENDGADVEVLVKMAQDPLTLARKLQALEFVRNGVRTAGVADVPLWGELKALIDNRRLAGLQEVTLDKEIFDKYPEQVKLWRDGGLNVASDGLV